MQGNIYQIDKEPLLEIPLIKVSENSQKPIIKLVDKILAIIKSHNLQNSSDEQVKTLEQEINTLIYKLYDLNNDEIKIIESSIGGFTGRSTEIRY